VSYFLKVKWIVIVVSDILHDIWKFAFFILCQWTWWWICNVGCYILVHYICRLSHNYWIACFLSTLVADVRALKQVCKSLCFMLMVLNSMTLATASWYCIYETLVNFSNNNMLPTLFLTWYTFLVFVDFGGYLYMVVVPHLFLDTGDLNYCDHCIYIFCIFF